MSVISKKPPLSDQIAAKIETLRADLPQSLLLIGDKGVGAEDIAMYLAGANLVDIIEPTDAKDAVDKEKGIIKVKQIRSLISSATTKSPSRRIYVISQADKMNMQAQNAFLKLLEEPTASTYFILVAHSQTALLPTVLSRCHLVHIPTLDNAALASLLAKQGIADTKTIAQISYLAMGKPELARRYAKDKNMLAESGETLRAAQLLIGGTTLEKLSVISSFSSDRTKALQLVDAARIILIHSLDNRPSHEIVALLSRLADTHERLRANGIVKLQLMAFVI